MQESAFYIERGIARACHYARDGQERCKEFYFEGELCLLYDSWLSGSPARYQLEAVTTLQLVRCRWPCWTSLPGNRSAWPCCASSCATRSARRPSCCSTPRRAIPGALPHLPHWPARLTQVQLANYIGISPVTLSRIRRRINTG